MRGHDVRLFHPGQRGAAPPRLHYGTPYGAEGAAIARRGSVATTTSSTPPSAQWASTVT